MAYATWPVSLGDPDKPVRVSEILPLKSGRTDMIGKYKSDRVRTRPTVKINATLIMDSSDFQLFLTFWRDTLSLGKLRFLADWISIAGYPGYSGRLINFSVKTQGAIPKLNMKIDLIPDVQLDPTQSFPDPWPQL